MADGPTWRDVIEGGVSVSLVAYMVTVRNEDPESLRRTLRSGLGQTLAGAVLLVDDASDEPIDVEPPVSVLRLERNLGISGARNAGLELLDPLAEFVAIYNCDVLLPAEWAQTCVAYLQAHPRCGAVWTGLEHAEPSTRARWWLDCQEISLPSQIGPTEFAPGHAVMFRRDALSAVHGYDAVNFRNASEDHDICRRMALEGFETHFTGRPHLVSLQDLSLDAMVAKDFVRMGLLDKPLHSQVFRVTMKALRRIARHVLARDVRLVPRDVAVGISGLRRALATRPRTPSRGLEGHETETVERG